MKKANFLTPVVTIFDEKGNLDIKGNQNVWEHLIKGGVDGLVIMGSTGEFFSMTTEQKRINKCSYRICKQKSKSLYRN